VNVLWASSIALQATRSVLLFVLWYAKARLVSSSGGPICIGERHHFPSWGKPWVVGAKCTAGTRTNGHRFRCRAPQTDSYASRLPTTQSCMVGLISRSITILHGQEACQSHFRSDNIGAQVLYRMSAAASADRKERRQLHEAHDVGSWGFQEDQQDTSSSPTTTAVLPKTPHSNSCKRVPNRPLRGRRGRSGTGERL